MTYEICCLCDKRIRHVNGRIQKYAYEVEMGGVHKLGGRVVRTKRRNVLRSWGCKPCYDSLAPPTVRTLLYNPKYVIWSPFVLIFFNIAIICWLCLAIHLKIDFSSFSLIPVAK